MVAMMDLTGQRYGRLVVLRRAEKRKPVVWKCRCDCGTIKDIRAGQLRTGKTRSCGCIALERIGQLRRSHGMSKMAEYKIWKDIKKRCFNPNHAAFKDYGGRGISVAREWRDSFPAFLEHIGPRPSPGHSVDRIDNSKGYEPGNCRWATHAEQSRNSRQNRMITHQGMTLTVTDWAALVGIDSKIVFMRLKYGWDPVDALCRPVKGTRATKKSLPSPPDHTTG